MANYNLREALASIPFILMHEAALAAFFALVIVLAWYGIAGTGDTSALRAFIDTWNPPDGAVRSLVMNIVSVQGAILAALGATAAYLWSLIFLALYFNVCLRLLLIGLSWRQAFDSLFVRLSLALTPLTVIHTEFQDVALRYTWLSHSPAHTDPATLKLISGWIKRTSRSNTLA